MTSESIVVVPLEEHPASGEIVGLWIEAQWRRLPIHGYYEAVAKGERWNRPLPRTLIAIDKVNGETVGTVSLLQNDMETRPELNPWLGCLYVAPPWRRKGIGRNLVEAAEHLARRLGVKELYLFAAQNPRFYERLGWVTVGTDSYENGTVTIMVKQLC